MSEHDDRLPMHQMLEHAREAVEMIRGRTRAELRTNRLLQLALAHLVQVVGEAATRVSRAGQTLHPEIPWVRASGPGTAWSTTTTGSNTTWSGTQLPKTSHLW